MDQTLGVRFIYGDNRMFNKTHSPTNRRKVLGGAIKIPKISPIEARLHCEITGMPKNITLSRSATGKYYASLFCDDGMEAPAKPELISNVAGLVIRNEFDQLIA